MHQGCNAQFKTAKLGRYDGTTSTVVRCTFRRQVKLVGNKQMFGMPKARKVRDIPLPDAVLEAINAHMTAYPPIEVTLPWGQDGWEAHDLLVAPVQPREGGARRGTTSTRSSGSRR
jgi:hypothetical protein